MWEKIWNYISNIILFLFSGWLILCTFFKDTADTIWNSEIFQLLFNLYGAIGTTIILLGLAILATASIEGAKSDFKKHMEED